MVESIVYMIRVHPKGSVMKKNDVFFKSFFRSWSDHVVV